LTSQGGAILVVVYLALCVAAFLLPAETETSGKESWALRLMGLWLVLPPLLTLAASLIKPLFDPGFMVMCVPAMEMLAARGLVKLDRVRTLRYWAATAILLVIAAFSLAALRKPPTYRITLNADWRSAINYVLSHAEAGDGAVFYVPNDYPFLYYARRAEHQHTLSSLPDVLYPPDPWQPLTREELENVTSGRKRVWLVLSNEKFNPNEENLVESALQERLSLQDQQVFSGDTMPITVKLFGANQER
jgi:hypothetical protein